jgi:hypothetical protein
MAVDIRKPGAFTMIGGFNVKNSDPIDSRMYVADISHVLLDANWEEFKPYPGLIVSDPNGEVRICVNSNYALASSWKKIGGGSLPVDTYADAVSQAAADNIGQLFYVKKTTYKKGTGYTETESEADKDADGKIVAEYTAGPYIVTGSGSVAKLGTTSATGNIAADVETLKGRVGTAESELDVLQTVVGDNTEGLVKDVADLQSTIGDANKGLVKDVADNAAEIESLKGAVAGGVHFRGVTNQGLPEISSIELESGDREYHCTLYGTGSEEESIVLSPGDVIIVEKGDSDDPLIVEPTKEYIFVLDGDNEPKWVELGDVSAEGQRISALESLIDSDKVSTWNTAATQASTLTANIANYALKTEVANDYVAKESGKSLVSDTLIAKLDGLANIKSVDSNSVLSITNNGALTADLSGYVAKDGNKVLSTNDYTNDEKTKLGNIAAGAQVNVIEEIKLNNKALTPSNKSVNIDLGEYAKDADKVDKTTTINDQPLSTNVVLDAQDIKTVTTIGADNAGATVETVLTSLNTKIGTVSTVANSALQEVFGSSTIAVTNKNTVSVKVKSNSAIKATADGLDLE